MTASEQDRPKLDAFSKPTNPRPRKIAEDAAQEPIVKAKPTQKEQEDELLAQTDAKETEGAQEAKARLSLYEDMHQALLPVQDYKKFLVEHAIDETDAEEIVDDLIVKGFYTESFDISRRYRVEFRTREHRDLLRLQMMFQVQQPVFQGAIDEMTVRYNLAASLVSFGSETFEFAATDTTDKDADDLFDKRMAYVERMPDPLFSKLSMKLALFDRKINAVMREGVSENF